MDQITRRRLLIGTILFSGLAVPLGPPGLRLIRDFAQPRGAINPSTRATMVRMARMLYPTGRLRMEFKLVSLVSLIPSLQIAKAYS